MRYIELTDVTGRTWKSDPDVDGELTDDAVGLVTKALENFNEISTLRLEVKGCSYFFNPANIISWVIKEEG